MRLQEGCRICHVYQMYICLFGFGTPSVFAQGALFYGLFHVGERGWGLSGGKGVLTPAVWGRHLFLIPRSVKAYRCLGIVHWRYLHHGNWQMLQIRAFFSFFPREPVVNTHQYTTFWSQPPPDRRRVRAAVTMWSASPCLGENLPSLSERIPGLSER